MRGQVSVPHVERVGEAAVTAMTRARRGLQQRGALSQHFVVVRPHSCDPRPPGRREFVEVTPALRGISPDQREVLRGEHDRAQHAQYLARRADRGAVQPCLVRPACHHIQVDGQLTALVDDDRRNDRALGARPEQAARQTLPGATQVLPNTTVPQQDWFCRSRWGRQTPCAPARGRGRPWPMIGNPAVPGGGRTLRRSPSRSAPAPRSYPDSLTRFTA